MNFRLLRLAALSLVLTAAACGDSTAPNVELTEEQIDDMMDAMAAAGSPGFVPPVGTLAVVTVTETADCPNGGTTTLSGTLDDNVNTGAFSMTITQGFTNCRSTSSSGRVWTFNGKPNIVTTMTGSENLTTGAFSFSGSQTGGITFSSDLGSGSCDFDVTITMTGNNNTEQFSGSISGTVCGRNISQSLSVS
jgi:hypothetical protein